jgi:antirestriction protein ArdC
MDVRQIVTDRIIAMLEKGDSVFRERWTRAAARGVPRNGKTGAPYRGANVLLLWEAAIEAGYASNVWLTYRQAQSLGAQVRHGERGVLCAHFERRARERGDDVDDILSEGGVDEEALTARSGVRAGVLLCRPFWLFNLAQIDGLPLEVVDLGIAPRAASQAPVERAMRLLGGCNATIRHGFDQAAYLPALDEIRLPWPRQFTSAEAQCATALHELVHWTGHPERLNRSFGRRFGDAAYAFEELVAELVQRVSPGTVWTGRCHGGGARRLHRRLAAGAAGRPHGDLHGGAPRGGGVRVRRGAGDACPGGGRGGLRAIGTERGKTGQAQGEGDATNDVARLPSLRCIFTSAS